MPLRTHRFKTTVVAGWVALALAGCTTGSDDATEPRTDLTGEATETGDRPPQEGEADDGPTEVESLATVSFPIGFVEDGELEVTVTSLEVTGELLRLAIAFTATLPDEVDDVALGAVLASNENAPGGEVRPEVIDPVNLKAYEVVAGAIPLGTAAYLTDASARTIVFYYAAPQDEVDALDIRLSSQAPALTDVPVGQ